MIRSILSILLFTICTSFAASQDKEIVFSYSHDYRNTEYTLRADRLTDEAFSRMGYTVQRKIHPYQRSNIMADEGEVDALPRRVYNFNSSYPNLRRVNESIAAIRFIAYSTRKEISLSGWSSLKGMGYRVIYFNGVHRCAEKLPAIVDPALLSVSHDKESALRMLMAGRVDIFVDVEDSINEILREDESLRGIYKAGVMESTESYIFLHKKHEAMIPELEQTIAQIKKDWEAEESR